MAALRIDTLKTIYFIYTQHATVKSKGSLLNIRHFKNVKHKKVHNDTTRNRANVDMATVS